jgi:hypothetical protein
VLALLVTGVLAGARGVVFARIRRRIGLRWTGKEAVLVAWQAGALLGLHLLVYVITDFIDYRIIGAHIVLMVVVLVGLGRLRMVAIVIGIHLLVLPAFMDAYRLLNGASYQVAPERLAAFTASLPADLRHDASTGNRWCSTVLSDVLSAELVTLPPGIGLSTYLSEDPIRMPVRSRWLLLSDTGYAALERAAAGVLNLRPLAENAVGRWYENLSAECG